MLSKVKKSNNSEGFTIIEVMIVLAIAALILLIVFLAVPALQRTSRNTQRKNDASAIASSVSEYVNNNGGSLPTTSGQFTTEFTGENPKLGIYTTPANVTYAYNGTTAPGAATTDPANLNKVVVASYMTCNSTNTAAAIGTSPQNVAIVYDVETASGMQEQCLTAG